MDPIEQDIKLFIERPLESTLIRLREKLRDVSDNPQEKDIIDLLSALLSSPAAFDLPSPDGNGEIGARLFSILESVQKGAIRLDIFRPLIRHIVDKSADIDIWEAIFDIINNLTPPLANITPSFRGTPIKSSSSWLADLEMYGVMERELFNQMIHCTFRNAGGFWEKFFDPKKWHRGQEAMLERLLTAHDGKKWSTFPKVPNGKSVWDWLRSLEKCFLDQAPYKFHTTETANQDQKPQVHMDIFLQRPAAEKGDTLWYKYVLVVGKQKEEELYDIGSFEIDLLQLTHHVRGVFTDQPTRRFVHAFSLCASKMELWVFDRSGAYSSDTFDIHDEPDKFARALVGYATMDDEAMGLDTFMERQDENYYVTLNDASDKEIKLRLDKALTRQKAIVSCGTACYETQDSHVAKFSWTSAKRELEFELLKRAEAMGVKGVVRAVAHRRITTTAEMREGLRFSWPYTFINVATFLDGLTAANSTSSKIKYFVDHPYDNQSGLKMPRSSNMKPSLYTAGENICENRIYSCLVVSPAGRVISDFRTARELLESERDAIKAHRSLFITGKILHRDISPNNIIITKPNTANGFKGMLIDLDMANVQDSEPSGIQQRIGTKQFMAIEVLRKKDHTYRHDLESFFYVLIWMCARQAWSKEFVGRQDPPEYSCLQAWEAGDFQRIAAFKKSHMKFNGLQNVMAEFPEALDVVKPLCLNIRNILFPYDENSLMSCGTPAGNPDKLYQPIISAFDDAISKLNL